MKLHPSTLLLAAALALASLATALAIRAADAPAAPTASTPQLPAKKIFFFTKSSGYEHSVIKRNAGNSSFAMQTLKELGAKNGLEFTESKDGSLFTPAYLATFDGYVFYTTGDLTLAKNTPALGDGNPPMTPAGKAALFAAIEGGKGFVGLHAAADTLHSPGNRDDNTPERYMTDGDKADPYIRMLGGEFIMHGAQQPGPQTVVDAKFPGMVAVPANFGPPEEWYSLKNFPADLHVLLVQETKGMNGAPYVRAPYPSTWARMQGKGRVFYTSMGHREDVWMNPVFQSLLLGALNWTTGRVDADVTPNLDKVAPQANELPKFPGNARGGARPATPAPAPTSPVKPATPTAPAPMVSAPTNTGFRRLTDAEIAVLYAEIRKLPQPWSTLPQSFFTSVNSTTPAPKASTPLTASGKLQVQINAAMAEALAATPALKPVATAQVDTGNYAGFRRLTDAEIVALAPKIAKELASAPHDNLSHFIDRAIAQSPASTTVPAAE